MKKPKKKSKEIIITPPTTLNPFADYIVQELPKEPVIEDLFEYKYKPKELKDFVGNHYAIKIIKKWVEEIAQQSTNQMLCFIHGPFGIGKSLLSSLVLKNFNIIECDNISEKNKFFEKLEKVITTKSIDESLFQAKPSAFIIENIDKNIGDGVYYKRLLDLLEKRKKTLKTPIICISSGTTLKKKYNTPSKVCIVRMDYPETNEMILFCKKIQEKEDINLSESAVELIISASRYDFRKILHYFKLLTLGKQKKQHTKKDIRKIIEFSETDVFYSAYEIVEEIYNDNIEKDVEDLINSCHIDQPLIADLLYSNIANGINIEGASSILEGFSRSDIFQKYIYKNHSWELRDYTITSGCINAFQTIKEQKNNKKQYKIKKNQLNNLPWTCIKNKNTFIETKNKSLYNNLKPEEMSYAFHKIIKPSIEQKLEEKTLTTEDVKTLQQYGIDSSLYSKLRNITFKELKLKALSKKNKTLLDKKYKELET